MARISCNKLWKMLIDQERKKPAIGCLLQLELELHLLSYKCHIVSTVCDWYCST